MSHRMSVFGRSATMLTDASGMKTSSHIDLGQHATGDVVSLDHPGSKVGNPWPTNQKPCTSLLGVLRQQIISDREHDQSYQAARAGQARGLPRLPTRVMLADPLAWLVCVVFSAVRPGPAPLAARGLPVVLVRAGPAGGGGRGRATPASPSVPWSRVDPKRPGMVPVSGSELRAIADQVLGEARRAPARRRGRRASATPVLRPLGRHRVGPAVETPR
jgi:hypothetical protein